MYNSIITMLTNMDRVFCITLKHYHNIYYCVLLIKIKPSLLVYLLLCLPIIGLVPFHSKEASRWSSFTAHRCSGVQVFSATFPNSTSTYHRYVMNGNTIMIFIDLWDLQKWRKTGNLLKSSNFPIHSSFSVNSSCRQPERVQLIQSLLNLAG